MSVSSSHGLPQIADRQTWQARIDELRVKEKAHTRAGDALAAERRRLPMVEVGPSTKLIGDRGPVSLIEIFDGRSQLVAYFQMWHSGKPAAEQCEGCTFSTSHISELAYLHSRDVSYATFCEGPYEESSRFATSRAGRFPGTRCRRNPLIVGGRQALRHPGQLSPRRRPGVRDLLDHRPR